ncbi:MAG: Uma2 family endonuclease, partial [Myxococcota bacterium]
NGRYQAQVLGEKGMWFEEAKLGLAIWTGEFCGLDRTWLRWYGADGEWIATQEEDRQVKTVQILEQEQQLVDQGHRLIDQDQQLVDQKQLIASQDQRLSEKDQQLEQQRQRAEQLAAKLRELGIDPDV